MEQEILELIKKENNLLLFRKNETKQEIYVLGTIHNYHLLETSCYSMAEVQSVIDTVQPDILLIEARQETLDIYNAVDGPIEMIFALSYATENNIPVKGIDWWYIAKNSEEHTALEQVRDDRMYDNIIAESADYQKILVICGASHRSRMPERFMNNGYNKIEIDNIIQFFNKTVEPFKYPQTMIAEIQRKNDYFQTGLLDELKRCGTEGDELYNHWMKTVTNMPVSMKAFCDDIVIPNKLYRQEK